VQLGRVEGSGVTHAHGVDGDRVRPIDRAKLRDPTRGANLTALTGLTAVVRRALRVRGAGADATDTGVAEAIRILRARLRVRCNALAALAEVPCRALRGRGAGAAIVVTV